MTVTALTNIGLLATGDPALGAGLLGEIPDAALLIEDGRVAWVGPASAAPAADLMVDLAGHAVIPGFVDSHSHIIFGGDRAAEFAARMAGESYSAGGIASTVAATRAAAEAELAERAAGFIREMADQGTTTVEIKSGYGLDLATEERLCRIAAALTEDVTYLGAHVVPAEYRADPEAYVDLVIGEMLDACAPHARWIDAFCETGAFSLEQTRRVLEAGAARGLGVRVHGAQLGPSEAVALAVELGAASIDHCTYLSERDIRLLAGSDTVATLLPGVEFSTRQPYPDARALLDAGVHVALASDCNPGSCFTSSMPLCIALAVREMGMTPAEAISAATAGGARALRHADRGVLRVGARADIAEITAPSYVHLAYRPGVPLIGRVWRAGERVDSRG
ncbi:imidazolonepropionase [Mycetocola spongiae]|uniref:imidazolonepropionase n=1 Tax=Mycetocola spongiae TaxID=2859226 RepID=UPI001CF17EF9|nr:imidazolonepropionase [Mycetocola spongiae]UCR89536.1 imidazolonepropionase [Mycetocola spongiae]